MSAKWIGRILTPIDGEEWIEKFRRREFWIALPHAYEQHFYSRITKSYIGWWLYFRVHAIWGRAALLLDPLASGGFLSHLECFLFNWLVVDLWWGLKRRIWKVFHKREWEKQREFMRACLQALEEGCDDPMEAPAWFPADKFHRSVLGKRYFQRVRELLDGQPKPDGGKEQQ